MYKNKTGKPTPKPKASAKSEKEMAAFLEQKRQESLKGKKVTAQEAMKKTMAGRMP